MENPFGAGRTATGPRFVNRSRELAALAAKIDGDRNLLLVAPRRMGKSTLLLEAFRRLDRRRFLPVFVDILKTNDENEVAQRLLDELGRVAFGRIRNGWLWLLEQLRHRRPAYTLDPQTGLPSLTLQKVDGGLPNLEEVLRTVEATARRRKRRIVVAIDEFQVVMERPAADKTIAAMRTIIQNQHGVTWIFSGSKRHILDRLVSDAENPFWGQLERIEIEGIPVDEFVPYVSAQFRRRRQEFPDTCAGRLRQLCDDNPKRIQQVLAEAWDDPGPPDVARLDDAVVRLLEEERHRFEDRLSELGEGPQKRLLFALARSGPDVAPYSREFLVAHDLGLPATVQHAGAGLREKGILDARLRFTDPFFRLFLLDGLPPAPGPETPRSGGR